MEMMTQIAPTVEDNEKAIALRTYIDANQVTQPGAANLWTGENTRSDLMPDLDNGLPDRIHRMSPIQD